MSFFGVRKEFSDGSYTPKTSINANGPGYPKKSSGLLFCLSKALGDRRKE